MCALVASGLTLWAAPIACPTGSLQSYLELTPGVGCSIGDSGFSYKDFGFTTLLVKKTDDNTKVATADSININPPASITDVLEISSGDFDVRGGDRVVYLFQYVIDPPPPIMPGYDIEMFSETPIFPGRAEATAFVCPGITKGSVQYTSEGLIEAVQCGGPGEPFTLPLILDVFHNGLPTGNKLFDSGLFNNPTNQMAVWIMLDLDASNPDENGNFGSSKISGIGAGVVPEPGSFALLAAGFSALAWFRRRRA